MRPGMRNPSSPLQWRLSEVSPHGLQISHRLLCRASVAAIWQDAEKVRQQRSRVVQTLNVSERFSKIGMAKGVSPFAKIHSTGERPTRSAVCASSGRHSLRLCWTVFLNSLLVLRGRLNLISTLCLAGSKLVFQLPANQGSFLPASMHLLSCRFFNQCDRLRPTRLWT